MRAIRWTTRGAIALIATVAMATPLLAAPTLVSESLAGGRGTLNWTQGVLTVTGSGAPPDRGSTAQRRLLAERAAQVDGYRQLAEIIQGVRVDSETVVKDFVIESDSIKTQVSALVRGARKVDTRYLSDGSVEVDLQVPLYGSSSLFAAIEFDHKIAKPIPGAEPQVMATPMPDEPVDQTAEPTPMITPTPESVRPAPRPTPEPARPAPRSTPRPAQPASTAAPARPQAPAAGGAYTGLIVDCREIAVQPAMSPAILDDGGAELYVGKLPIDPDQVIAIGIVGYASGLEEAKGNKDRVGDRPLIVKAKKASGQYKADVVLAATDAGSLLEANRVRGFLAQSRVMFVLRP